MPADWWGLGFAATGTSEFGNKITLAPSGGSYGYGGIRLSNVVVQLDSQAGENGNSTPCTTTPGATFSVPITLTIYKPGSTGGTVGSVIASDTQTFNIPYRPSAGGAACETGSTGVIYAGATNNGTQWFDSATGDCYYGQTIAITFNNFGNVSLPSTVVYGISFATNATNANISSSAPVNLLDALVSVETQSGGVTVGSDTDPNNVFLSTTGGAAAGPGGELSCDTAVAGFVEYGTALGAGAACGSSIGYGAADFIPAVEFNTSG
jgi:hypothetical protein